LGVVRSLELHIATVLGAEIRPYAASTQPFLPGMVLNMVITLTTMMPDRPAFCVDS
jgi:hypothetical protein